MILRCSFLSFIALLVMCNSVVGALGEVEEDHRPVRWVIGGDLEELNAEGISPILSFKEHVENNCSPDRNGELIGEGMFLSLEISNFLENGIPEVGIVVQGGDRGFDISKQLIGVSDLCLSITKEGGSVLLIENRVARWLLNEEFYGIPTIRFLLQKEPYSSTWGCFAELVKNFGTPEEVTLPQLRGD